MITTAAIFDKLTPIEQNAVLSVLGMPSWQVVTWDPPKVLEWLRSKWKTPSSDERNVLAAFSRAVQADAAETIFDAEDAFLIAHGWTRSPGSTVFWYTPATGHVHRLDALERVRRPVDIEQETRDALAKAIERAEKAEKELAAARGFDADRYKAAVEELAAVTRDRDKFRQLYSESQARVGALQPDLENARADVTVLKASRDNAAKAHENELAAARDDLKTARNALTLAAEGAESVLAERCALKEQLARTDATRIANVRNVEDQVAAKIADGLAQGAYAGFTNELSLHAAINWIRGGAWRK